MPPPPPGGKPPTKDPPTHNAQNVTSGRSGRVEVGRLAGTTCKNPTSGKMEYKTGIPGIDGSVNGRPIKPGSTGSPSSEESDALVNTNSGTSSFSYSYYEETPTYDITPTFRYYFGENESGFKGNIKTRWEARFTAIARNVYSGGGTIDRGCYGSRSGSAGGSDGINITDEWADSCMEFGCRVGVSYLRENVRKNTLMEIGADVSAILAGSRKDIDVTQVSLFFTKKI